MKVALIVVGVVLFLALAASGPFWLVELHREKPS